MNYSVEFLSRSALCDEAIYLSDEIATLRYATFAMTRNRVSFYLSPGIAGLVYSAMTT